MTWISRLRPPSPEIDSELREQIATTVEGVSTVRIDVRLKDLRHTDRDVAETSLANLDSKRSAWSATTAKGTTQGMSVGDVAYRRMTPSESAKTGKQWVGIRFICEGFGRDWRTVIAAAIRTTPTVRARRLTHAIGQRVYQYDFDFSALSEVDGEDAMAVSAYLRDHRARGMTMTAFITEADGQLLRLHQSIRQIATCASPSMWCRSATDFYEFGVEVPEVFVPSDDQIFWIPLGKALHR
ncbi:MAG: hypothetical protein JF587_05625 [Catenulisporales bacterium]|nr:hypothetical protein [Catenulisporales bacterium]